MDVGQRPKGCASISPKLLAVSVLEPFGSPCLVQKNVLQYASTSLGLIDHVVVCGEKRYEDDRLDTLLNPTLIAEVLSDTTERFNMVNINIT